MNTEHSFEPDKIPEHEIQFELLDLAREPKNIQHWMMDAELRRLYDLSLRSVLLIAFTWAFPAWYLAGFLARKRVVLVHLYGPMSAWRAWCYMLPHKLLVFFALGWGCWRVLQFMLWLSTQ